MRGYVPIPTFMFLWAIYIIYSSDRSAYSDSGKYVGRTSEEIDRSQTHEYGNWDWGRTISFLGIHKFKFLCSAYCTPLLFPQIVYILYLPSAFQIWSETVRRTWILTKKNPVRLAPSLVIVLCWNFRTIYGGLGTEYECGFRTGLPAELIPGNQFLCSRKSLNILYLLCISQDPSSL